MLFNDKKRALSRAAIGGLVGTAVLIPVGGLFNDLVNGGLIATGPHTPFRMVSYDLEVLVGAAPWPWQSRSSSTSSWGRW